MKVFQPSTVGRLRRGLTLIELTVVIIVLLTLLTMSFVGTNSIRDWQRARTASTVLRDVETAQVEFLADNPLVDVANLTEDNVAQYLLGSPDELPTAIDLDGNELTVNFNVSPPVLLSGGAVYDPSGSPSDSLWDVGTQ